MINNVVTATPIKKADTSRPYDLLKTTISNHNLQEHIDTVIQQEIVNWKKLNYLFSIEGLISRMVTQTKYSIKKNKYSSGIISSRPTDIILTEDILDHIFKRFKEKMYPILSLIKEKMASLKVPKELSYELLTRITVSALLSTVTDTNELTGHSIPHHSSIMVHDFINAGGLINSKLTSKDTDRFNFITILVLLLHDIGYSVSCCEGPSGSKPKVLHSLESALTFNKMYHPIIQKILIATGYTKDITDKIMMTMTQSILLHNADKVTDRYQYQYNTNLGPLMMEKPLDKYQSEYLQLNGIHWNSWFKSTAISVRTLTLSGLLLIPEINIGLPCNKKPLSLSPPDLHSFLWVLPGITCFFDNLDITEKRTISVHQGPLYIELLKFIQKVSTNVNGAINSNEETIKKELKSHCSKQIETLENSERKIYQDTVNLVTRHIIVGGQYSLGLTAVKNLDILQTAESIKIVIQRSSSLIN